MMLRCLPSSPRPATLRVEPASTLAVFPRGIIGTRVTLHALKRRNRELDLRERVDPRDDKAPIGNDRHTSLAELVREPPRKFVPSLAVERPSASHCTAQPKARD